MRSKIIIRLGPKIAIPINLSFLNIPKGLAGVYDIVSKLNLVAALIFILGIFTWQLLSEAAGANLLIFVYAAVIIFAFFYLIKNLVAKKQLVDLIPFDIPVLVFTTLIAFSLFLSTAVFKNSDNIWGGSNLRVISGVAIISFWFLYYLLTTTFLKKKLIQKSIFAFWLAPLYTLFIWLITFSDLIPSQQVVLGLLLPANIWLLLTQSKHTWLHLINTIISLVVLITFEDRTVITINLLVFTISILVIVVRNRNWLGKMFSRLDNIPRSKNAWGEYIRNNSTIAYLIVSSLAFAVGVFWAIKNLTNVVFDPLIIGSYSLQFDNVAKLMLGNGLNTIAASSVLKFINVYGLIPTLGLVICLFFIVREIIKSYKKTTSTGLKGIILWILTAGFAGFLYLLLASAYVETLILTLVILLLFAGLIKQFIDNKVVSSKSVEVIDFSSIKNKRNQTFMKIVQILLIFLLFFTTYYLLSSLNYINIFLVTN